MSNTDVRFQMKLSATLEEDEQSIICEDDVIETEVLEYWYLGTWRADNYMIVMFPWTRGT